MSVMWYVKRLGAMSSRELLHRIEEQVKRSSSRRRSYGWSAFPACGPVLEIPGSSIAFAPLRPTRSGPPSVPLPTNYSTGASALTALPGRSAIPERCFHPICGGSIR